MIRINLLPVKASRRQEAVRTELVLAAIVFVLVGGSLFGLQYMVDKDRQELVEENDHITKEIERLKIIVGEVDKLESLKADLETKLKVIGDLKKNKTGPVHMLDEIAQATPDRLRLKTLSENGGLLQLTGTALSNDVISQFLTNLEQSPYFESVYLNQISQVEVDKIKLKDFSLNAKVVLSDEPAPAPPPAEAAPPPPPPPAGGGGEEG